MEDKKLIGVLLVVFIGVILGMVFLSQIAADVDKMADVQTYANESLDISSIYYWTVGQVNVNSSKNFTLDSSNWTTSGISLVANSSGDTLTENTDWKQNYTTKVVYFLNTTNMLEAEKANNRTYITYTGYDDNYITSSSATRTIVSLIILMTAIGIMVYVVGMLWKNGTFDYGQ